jgi:MFS family permease
MTNRVLAGLGVRNHRAERRWAMVSLVDSVGSGLVAPVTVLYFTHLVRLSTTSVGTGLTLAGVIALCAAPLAGLATDRFGPGKTLVGYWALSAVAYAAHGLVHGWAGFVTVTSAALVSGYSTKSVKQAFLAELAEGADRVRLMASQRTVRNAGFALGGLLCSVALTAGTTGYLVIVYGNAFSYTLAACVVTTIPLDHGPQEAPARERQALSAYLPVLRDGRYMALTVLDFLVGFQATALDVAVPLWVVSFTRAPATMVGVLFTVNTLVVVFLQVRVATRSPGIAGTPRLHVRSAVLFCLASAAYLLAGHASSPLAVASLIGAMLLHSATELYASTAEWTVATEMADPSHRGKYLAVFWSGSSLQQTVGPLMVTSLLAMGAASLWPALAVLFAVGGLLSAYVVRRAGSDVAGPKPFVAAG